MSSYTPMNSKTIERENAKSEVRKSQPRSQNTKAKILQNNIAGRIPETTRRVPQ